MDDVFEYESCPLSRCMPRYTTYEDCLGVGGEVIDKLTSDTCELWLILELRAKGNGLQGTRSSFSVSLLPASTNGEPTPRQLGQ